MNTPPKIVNSRGQTLKPGDEEDAIDRILAQGDTREPLLPRRVVITLVAILAVAIAAVGFGLSETSRTEVAGQTETDRAVRELAAYAEAANNRQAPFPPDSSGTIVVTILENNIRRVTSRGFDGTCWQVIAYTIPDPQNPDNTILDVMETVPYQVEPIHCRFNR